jgi:alpha-beta hydrolase superfamily lysophospholipase
MSHQIDLEQAHPAPPAFTRAQGTWLLLRGLTRERGHWGDFAQDWAADLPPGSRVITLELAGNGARCADRSPASVPGLLADLREQLRAMAVPPPYHVFAMSLGAMVTVEWAHQHPEELIDAVLVNTSLKPHSPMWRRLQPRWWPVILRLLLTRASSAEWERCILDMTSRHPPDAEATLARWQQLRDQHPVQPLNALRQLWAAARYRAPPSRPPVPVLLLNGLGDQLVHPSCSAVLAARWGAPLLRHPTAGHDLPLDAGPWVRQQVLHWLAQGPQQPLRA